MTEENVQAHLNDCSQHSSKFICHECGMVSEIFCDTCTCFIFNSKLILFSKTNFFLNYSCCFFRSMKYLTWVSHPYLQRGTMKKWSKGMMKWWREKTKKLKLKNISLKNTCINQVLLQLKHIWLLPFFLTHSFQWTYSTLILVVTNIKQFLHFNLCLWLNFKK